VKVTLSEADARSLAHPKYAPHGVEREAEYRVLTLGDIYSSIDGLVRCECTVGEFPWLVVTPRKPSLAQLVKESGWRSPFGPTGCLLYDPHGRYWCVAGSQLADWAKPQIMVAGVASQGPPRLP
jgi:hypothetical protein